LKDISCLRRGRLRDCHLGADPTRPRGDQRRVGEKIEGCRTRIAGALPRGNGDFRPDAGRIADAQCQRKLCLTHGQAGFSA
jgi:hypothetical protein